MSHHVVDAFSSCVGQLFLNDFPRLLIETNGCIATDNTSSTDKQKNIASSYVIDVYFVLFQSGSSSECANPEMAVGLFHIHCYPATKNTIISTHQLIGLRNYTCS